MMKKSDKIHLLVMAILLILLILQQLQQEFDIDFFDFGFTLQKEDPFTTERDPVFNNKSIISIKMVLFEGGCFTMGSRERDGTQQSFRKVCLDSFEIDQHEVTVAEYQKCVEQKKCNPPLERVSCNWKNPTKSNHPINCINWFDARTYCIWKEKELPSEAQWEYAAGGKYGFEYPWGNIKPDCTKAVAVELEGYGCNKNSTWPVCSKPMGNTKESLCDTAGNVWEWTMDDYFKDSAKNPLNKNFNKEKKLKSNDFKIIRGGGWIAVKNKIGLKRTSRNYINSNATMSQIGFRCLRNLK